MTNPTADALRHTIDIPEADLAKIAQHNLRFARYQQVADPGLTEPTPQEYAYARKLAIQVLVGMTMAEYEVVPPG